jgi:Gpi18-like mannosyltransferase
MDRTVNPPTHDQTSPISELFQATLSLLTGGVGKLILIASVIRFLWVAIGFISYASVSNPNVNDLGLDTVYFKYVAAPFAYGDVNWYMDIAQNGYEQKPFTTDEKSNWAFYPLWPLILRLGNLIVPNMLLWGMIASTTFFLGAIFYLYRLILLDFEEEVAFHTVLLVILFPVAYFTFRPGPESAFLFLVVASLYYARRKTWVLAGLLAALATLTRFQGLLLLFPFLFIYMRQFKTVKKHDPGILSLLLVPISQFLFMLHLYFKSGNLFAGFLIQKAWDNELSFPMHGVIKFFFRPHLISYYGWDLAILSVLFILLALGITVYLTRKPGIPPEYLVYTILSLLLIVSRDNTNASLRYMLPVFPLFLGLAFWVIHNKWIYHLVVYTFTALQLFYFLSFLHYYHWAMT